MYPIRPVAKDYAWGSYGSLQRMFASDPSVVEAGPDRGKPLAEMWFSAHAGSPSIVATPDLMTLPDLIASNPQEMLGYRCSAKFGPVLPYLLKIISARIPLSLQVHPVDFEARTGYNAENLAGVPFGDPERSFSDPVAKSEMVVALEPFEASIGFAPLVTMISNLAEVDHPVAQRMLRALTRGRSGFPTSGFLGVGDHDVGNSAESGEESFAREGQDIAVRSADVAYDDGRASDSGSQSDDGDFMMPPGAKFASPSRRRIFRAFRACVCASGDEGKGLADALRFAAGRAGGETSALSFAYALKACETFHEDPSSLALLMMNPVALTEGDAVFIPAGTPHAYIHGTAAEIMTNSDNVLRAGLTTKHKNIAGFLRTVNCRPAAPIDPSVNLPEALAGNHVVYRPRIDEFMLTYGQVGHQGGQWPLISHLRHRYGRLVAGARRLQRHFGPRIVVCTQGAVQCVTASQRCVIGRGEAVFVPACDGWLEIRSAADEVRQEGVLLVDGWRDRMGSEGPSLRSFDGNADAVGVSGGQVVASSKAMPGLGSASNARRGVSTPPAEGSYVCAATQI